LRQRAFDPARFAVLDAVRVGVEKSFDQSLDLRARHAKTSGRNFDAGNETHHVDCEGREAGFVKIVQIEIAQAIVAFESAEILEM
jgi:hypothetical protein